MTDKGFRVAIIGCGNILHAHAPRIERIPEIRIVGLCDIKPGQAEKWHERLAANGADKAPVYTDYRSMIDECKPDAALILTPHNLHYEQALYCLESGVHILLEKPMCLGVDECRHIMDVAEAKGLSLVIGYHRHYDPEYVRAKRFIENGGIGQVQLVAGVLTQDWQRGCQGKWRLDKAISGGGQLNDSGSHLQDIALWLCGCSAAEVSATVDNNGEEVDIFSSISARLENGAVMSLVVSGGPAPWGEQLSIWGSKGAVHYQHGRFTFVDTHGKELDGGEYPVTSDPVRNLMESALGLTAICSTGLDGLRVQELTRAAYESGDTGKRVILRKAASLV